MKNSISIFVITFLFLTNLCIATTINNPFCLLNKTEFTKKSSEFQETVRLAKPSLNEETEVFNPETVIAYTAKTLNEIIAEEDKIIENSILYEVEFKAYELGMKEIIRQSDLIIESKVSNEIHLLSTERTIEDEIAQMELIIESTVLNETRLLDLKMSNNSSILINTFHSKTLVGMN